MKYIGRLQQAETELIKYLLIKGDVVQAANIAIRMLMEDKYVFLDAEAMAIKALLQYTTATSAPWTGMHASEYKRDLMIYWENWQSTMNPDGKQQHQDVALTYVTAKSCQSLGPLFGSSRSTLSARWSLPENSSRFVTMEQF